MLLVREALRMGTISFHKDFFSVTLGEREGKARLKDELENFSVITEPSKTLFGQTRRTFTGKLGIKPQLESLADLKHTTHSCLHVSVCCQAGSRTTPSWRFKCPSMARRPSGRTPSMRNTAKRAGGSAMVLWQSFEKDITVCCTSSASDCSRSGRNQTLRDARRVHAVRFDLIDQEQSYLERVRPPGHQEGGHSDAEREFP